jgi:hypothetical protein
MIHYIPFVVLESAWTLVALTGILKKLMSREHNL